MKRSLFALFLLFAAVAVPAAPRRRAVSLRPQYPPCAMVTGASAVTFTRNEGVSLARLAVQTQPIAYTYGLAAMPGEDDTLVAWHRDDLLLSTDGGCSWRVSATVAGSDFPPKLEAAQGNRVYAWSENRLFFVRHDPRGTSRLRQPVEFLGLNADAANGEHLRAGGIDGSVWESRDGGDSWSPIGAKIDAPFFYRFVFNPLDLDHIVAGTGSNGAFVSRNGGQTWVRATGLGNSANVFHFVLSPVDANRVWAFGIDLEQSAANHPSHGRHIYLSDDGGATYRPVVDEAPGVKLINGPTMAAHPVNRDVLYFVFGTHFQDYGTDLFRFHAGTGTLTMTHSTLDDINAIVISSRNPGVMYLGIEAVTLADDTE